MPAMYQSIQNLGSTERNERARDGADPRGLYTNHDVPAVAPEELGRQYLSALLSSLRALETTEAEAMEAATAHCAAVVSAGRRVFPFLISHFPPHQWGCPGDPMLMEPPVGLSLRFADQRPSPLFVCAFCRHHLTTLPAPLRSGRRATARSIPRRSTRPGWAQATYFSSSDTCGAPG